MLGEQKTEIIEYISICVRNVDIIFKYSSTPKEEKQNIIINKRSFF